MRATVTCGRMRLRSGRSRRRRPFHALGRGACRRSGLNTSRCARDRRSNARPLSARPYVSCAQRLTIGPCACGRICSRVRSHAYRTCRACVVRDATAMAAHGWPRGARSRAARAWHIGFLTPKIHPRILYGPLLAVEATTDVFTPPPHTWARCMERMGARYDDLNEV